MFTRDFSVYVNHTLTTRVFFFLRHLIKYYYVKYSKSFKNSIIRTLTNCFKMGSGVQWKWTTKKFHRWHISIRETFVVMSLGSCTLTHPETPLTGCQNDWHQRRSCIHRWYGEQDLHCTHSDHTVATQWPHTALAVLGDSYTVAGISSTAGFCVPYVQIKKSTRVCSQQFHLQLLWYRNMEMLSSRWPHEHTWCFTQVMEYYSPPKRTWRNLKHTGEVNPCWRGSTVYDWNMTLYRSYWSIQRAFKGGHTGIDAESYRAVNRPSKVAQW